MGETFKGTIHGKRIELEQKLSLPEGLPVIVTIEAVPLSDEERRRRILEMAGAWKNDPSIPGIFEGLAQERRTHREREILMP